MPERESGSHTALVEVGGGDGVADGEGAWGLMGRYSKLQVV